MMKMQIDSYIFKAILFVILPINLFSALLDIEKDLSDDFVVSTKKIEIPGYPDAFNPSILRWHDSILLSFRLGSGRASASENDSLIMSFRFRDPLNGSTNGIGLVLLDSDFNLISTPQELEIPRIHPYFAARQQDPRLIQVGDRIFVVYSNIIEGIRVPEIRRMFISEVVYENGRFYAGRPECFLRFEGENENRWQKNWVPFDYGGNLFLSYSINPHRVLQPLLGTGECITIASTTSNTIQWNWGVLRGGTTALIDGDEYLAFFHSSLVMPTVQSEGKKIQHYFMGAYTFTSYPPFSLTRISKKPIVASGFYNGPVHSTWKPLRVVFPCGHISNDSFVWVAYGRQDHEIWIAKLDKKLLYESMVPVHTTD